MFERDPGASFETLQNSLQQAVQQPHIPGLGLISHAAILIKTSNHTVKAVDELREEIRRLDSKNGKLQNWVIGLAVASLLATCVQTYVALRPPASQGTAPSTPPKVVSILPLPNKPAINKSKDRGEAASILSAQRKSIPP